MKLSTFLTIGNSQLINTAFVIFHYFNLANIYNAFISFAIPCCPLSVQVSPNLFQAMSSSIMDRQSLGEARLLPLNQCCPRKSTSTHQYYPANNAAETATTSIEFEKQRSRLHVSSSKISKYKLLHLPETGSGISYCY